MLRRRRSNGELVRQDWVEVLSTARETLESRWREGARQARVLEIGCGQRFALTLLFHPLGLAATGMDAELVEPSSSARSLFRMWRSNGAGAGASFPGGREGE